MKSTTPKVQRFDKKSEAGLRAFLWDMARGLSKWRIWTSFASEEIHNRFYGSVLGVLWMGISFLIFVLAIALYFRSMSGDSLMYVAIGMAVYQYAVGNVTDGCNVFIQAKGWIQGAPLPFSIYVYKSLARSLVPFVINVALCVAIAGFAGWRPHGWTLMPILAFLVLMLNAVWVHFLFGLINTRVRDFGHLVNALTRLLFFTAPILWDYASTAGLRRLVADLNPMTHFIQILRMPLLGETEVLFHWQVVWGITAGGWLMTFIAMSRFRHKLARWVEH